MAVPQSNNRLPWTAAIVVAVLGALGLAFAMPGCFGGQP